MSALRWRFYRFIREVGLLLAALLFVPPLVYVLLDPRAGGERVLESGSGLWRFTVLPVLLLCLGSGLRWWLRYKRLRGTLDCGRVLDSILASDASYCLMLRTFGGDGKVLLPTHPQIGLWSPALTLEQVTAQALSRHHGMRSYTLVDAAVRHSPPGPVYLRSSDEDWRDHIAALVGKAAHIVLLLAPGREMRPSLAWEIELIRSSGLQHRVTIVFPPCGRKGTYDPSHLTARNNAERILAMLELSYVDVGEVGTLMHHALAVRILQAEDPERRRTVHVVKVWSTVLTPRGIIGAKIYDRALAQSPMKNGS
ncbi:hypothetical protein ACIRD2_14560 [Streptomyces sp. NPDC093595]|uniref:hypothetical protein n=1 Tax=Streptomyces sp. NPDC093595 TaxID=3366045 RepID=UPI003822E0FD